jgi:nucleoid-associated protein YgaU
VTPGDTLWEIAEAALGAGVSDAQVAVAVAELYSANRGVVGDDPDLILPGQVLELPDW